MCQGHRHSLEKYGNIIDLIGQCLGGTSDGVLGVILAVRIIMLAGEPERT